MFTKHKKILRAKALKRSLRFLAKYRFVIISFLLWKVSLFVFLSLAVKFVPLQSNFIGGLQENYVKNPLLWSGLNFDGEHYLSIAQNGYQPLTYFFFPVYPLLVSLLGDVFRGSFESLAYIGIIVSHVSFFMALVGIWKLILMDGSEKIARYVVWTVLLFPTSFFFQSFYTESLFLLLVVWSFYFFRNGRFFLAGILGGISSATRVTGSILAVSFFADLYKKKKFRDLLYLLMVPLGILGYMYYLKVRTGDPFEFFRSVSVFGEQRSSHLILLPQVFYRYFFEILPNLNYSYFPVVFTTFLELGASILFLVLSILSFWRLKLDYAIYLFLGYMTPTFSGSFSSMSRYVLVLFPGFILLASYIVKWPRFVRFLYFLISFVALGVATVFFTRGLWIA